MKITKVNWDWMYEQCKWCVEDPEPEVIKEFVKTCDEKYDKLLISLYGGEKIIYTHTVHADCDKLVELMESIIKTKKLKRIVLKCGVFNRCFVFDNCGFEYNEDQDESINIDEINSKEGVTPLDHPGIWIYDDGWKIVGSIDQISEKHIQNVVDPMNNTVDNLRHIYTHQYYVANIKKADPDNCKYFKDQYSELIATKEFIEYNKRNVYKIADYLKSKGIENPFMDEFKYLGDTALDIIVKPTNQDVIAFYSNICYAALRTGGFEDQIYTFEF